MKDKHVLPLFSTSARTHSIKLPYLSGYEWPQRFCKPKTVILFSPFNHKNNFFFNTPEPEEEEKRTHGWQQQKKQIHLKRCRMSTQKISTDSHKCASLLSNPSALLTREKTTIFHSFHVLACDKESPGTLRKISKYLWQEKFGLYWFDCHLKGTASPKLKSWMQFLQTCSRHKNWHYRVFSHCNLQSGYDL